MSCHSSTKQPGTRDLNANRQMVSQPGKMEPLGVMHWKKQSLFVANTLSSMGVPSLYFGPRSTHNSSSGARSGPFEFKRHSKNMTLSDVFFSVTEFLPALPACVASRCSNAFPMTSSLGRGFTCTTSSSGSSSTMVGGSLTTFLLLRTSSEASAAHRNRSVPTTANSVASSPEPTKCGCKVFRPFSHCFFRFNI